MRRRAVLAGCACAGFLARSNAFGQAPSTWAMPPRFAPPELASDEGGLWAVMDREENRLKRSAFLLKDQALSEYLAALVCRLAGTHCPDIRVYVMRTPWFNASMAPNGMVQIWSGLLLRLDNEAQLAAILAHELAHYISRHSLERLRDARSRAAFATLMLPFGLLGAIGQLAAMAGKFAFTREQERDADRIGMELMAGAGYDPRQAAEIWTQLLAEVKAGEDAGGDPARSSVLFATHPEPAEREADLRERASAIAGTRELALGADEYQRIVRPLRRSMLEDELRRRRSGESIHLLQRLITKSGDERGELRYFLAEVHRQRGSDNDVQRALELYDAATQSGNPPPELFRGRALLRWQQGDRVVAVADFQRYLELSPQANDADLIRSYLKGN